MKKKIIIILAAIALVLIIGFLVKDTRNPNSEIGNGEEGALSQISTFISSELGLRFSYPVGTNGYVLKIITPTESSQGPLKTIVLMRAEDAMQALPMGGEGAPTITISVFKNSKKQFPLVWANQNIQYSNINLKNGDIGEVVVGGANAIRYMADGLYSSENVVVAHGENMYVLSGMYLDANSSLRKDFSPIVESVTFISQYELELSPANDWKTFTDSAEGITFKYPENIPTKYIHTVDWPPVVQITNDPFMCTEAKKTIAGKNYCVTEISDGAAGSIYTQYVYATELENKTAFFTFTLRAVQCDNYDDPEKTACKDERSSFNIDSLIDQVIQTAELK